MSEPMTPMERAARAAGDTLRQMGYEDVGGPTEHRHIARAVIAAIRQPSPKMVAATRDFADDVHGSEIATRDWQAMIDAALAEGERDEDPDYVD